MKKGLLFVLAYLVSVALVVAMMVVDQVSAQEVSADEFTVHVPISIISGPTGIAGLEVMATVNGAVEIDCQGPTHGLPACANINAVSMAIVDVDGVWTNAGDTASAGTIVLTGPPGSYTVELAFPKIDDDAGNSLVIAPLSFTVSFGP